MARKVMDELEEIMRPEKQMEEISDKLLQKAIIDRQVREHFNNKIYKYLKDNHKSMGELNKEDVAKMSGHYALKYQGIFMEQVMKALQTNRGKPIKRIREHNKSVLLNQLD